MSNLSDGAIVTIRTAPGMQLTPEARKKIDELTAELQKTGAKVILAASKCRGFFCGEYETDPN